jgi:hypothetical protein
MFQGFHTGVAIGKEIQMHAQSTIVSAQHRQRNFQCTPRQLSFT